MGEMNEVGDFSIKTFSSYIFFIPGVAVQNSVFVKKQAMWAVTQPNIAL